jgi:gas vesicle protein
MQEKQQQGGGSFVFGLLLGGLIGAAVGIWKAPASGEETRQRLVQQGTDAVSRAEKAVVGERPEDALAEGRALARQRQQELAQGE